MDANVAAPRPVSCHHFGDTQLVKQNSRKFRVRSLVIATSLALAGTAAAAPRIDKAGMDDGQRYDRFVVKYRDGSPEQSNPAELRRALAAASVGANQMIQGATAQRGGGAGKPVVAEHVRRMSMGAVVVSVSR